MQKTKARKNVERWVSAFGHVKVGVGLLVLREIVRKTVERQRDFSKWLLAGTLAVLYSFILNAGSLVSFFQRETIRNSALLLLLSIIFGVLNLAVVGLMRTMAELLKYDDKWDEALAVTLELYKVEQNSPTRIVGEDNDTDSELERGYLDALTLALEDTSRKLYSPVFMYLQTLAFLSGLVPFFIKI